MSEPASNADDELPPLLASDDEGGADDPTQSQARRQVPELLLCRATEMQLRRRAAAFLGLREVRPRLLPCSP